MTDMGGGVWRKVVNFSITALGDALEWKFVNGNWGAKEGDSTLSFCGTSDGFGGYNRLGPTVPVTVKFCWNQCTQCDGSSPIIISSVRCLPQSIRPLSVYPNPFNGEMNINYENARSSKVSVEIVNLLGQLVKSLFNGQQGLEFLFVIEIGIDEAVGFGHRILVVHPATSPNGSGVGVNDHCSGTVGIITPQVKEEVEIGQPRGFEV
jgi:hypothetical protein